MGSKKVIKKITEHAVVRAYERSITKETFARTMAYGTKYIDIESGEKVLHHDLGRTALILDKNGNTVLTNIVQIL